MSEWVSGGTCGASRVAQDAPTCRRYTLLSPELVKLQLAVALTKEAEVAREHLSELQDLPFLANELELKKAQNAANESKRAAKLAQFDLASVERDIATTDPEAFEETKRQIQILSEKGSFKHKEKSVGDPAPAGAK